MGAGDLATFREAGRALFSLGLLREQEGNLSTWEGERLTITRTRSRLFDLQETDVLRGTLDDPPAEASSDLEIHAAMYRANGPGAVVHAHPPGTVPDGWVEGQPHGRYAHAETLGEAVERLVDDVRTGVA